MAWHEVGFPRRTVREIELMVTDLVRGADDDVCVSEIELYDGDRQIDMAMPACVLFSKDVVWLSPELIEVRFYTEDHGEPPPPQRIPAIARPA